MRTRVQHTATTSLLCVLVITAFLATQTEVTAQTTIQTWDTPVTIPVGEYVALLERPVPPSVAPLTGVGSYDIIFYDLGWDVRGMVAAGPIDICVLNNSNYQYFNNSQQYSVFQQLSCVIGVFGLHVAVPNNGPNGTYVFHFNNASYYWWIVFDNRAGSSNATLNIDSNGESVSVRYVFPSNSSEGFVRIAVGAIAAGVLVAVLLWICSAFLEKRRAVHRQPRANIAH